MQHSIRCAVIGVGNMGQHHARIYSELPQAKLIAVSDTHKGRGENIASKFGADYYDDYRDILNAKKVDAVSVCVPTSLHYSVALTCLEHGVNVLVEKPVAHTVALGNKLIHRAQQTGKILMVGHVERFNPVVVKAKELIDKGEFGDILNIIARRVGPFPPQIRDVGISVDLAIHDIDILNYFLGRNPDYVYVERHQNSEFVEDSVEFVLQYGSHSAYVQTNWVTPVKIRKIAITGTLGYLEMDSVNQSIFFYKNILNNSGVFASVKTEVVVEQQEPLKEELVYFLDCIVTKHTVDSRHAVDALAIALR